MSGELRRPSFVSTAPPVTWLGLAWVWSGLLWLLGLYAFVTMGWLGGSLAMAVRLAASLALGVGLCATERWAWAPCLCLSAVYAAVGGAFAVSAAYVLLTMPPTTLSWMPLFLGLSPGECRRAAVLAAVLAFASGGALWLLLRSQAVFDVPHRRLYATLVRFGIVPALAVLAADAYLLWGWWMLQVRYP